MMLAKKRLLDSAVFWVALAVCQQSVHAIVTSDFIGSHTVPSRHAFDVNLDGVALLGGIGPTGLLGGSCSAALISDRHLLTAAHCLDEEADLRVDDFWFDFASSAVFVVEGIPIEISFDPENVQWPSSWGELRSDIAILTLDEDAPGMLPRYDVYAGSNEIGQQFVLAGFGNAGHGSSGEDFAFDPEPVKRAGINRYEAVFPADEENEFLVYDFDNGEDSQNTLALIGFESDLGFGADEVLSAGRDSGGPGFLGGAIASITAFGDRVPSAGINEDLDSSWGESGFDLRVSKYRNFISTSTNGAVTFVPEPCSALHASLTIVVVTLLCRQRCRRR